MVVQLMDTVPNLHTQEFHLLLLFCAVDLFAYRIPNRPAKATETTIETSNAFFAIFIAYRLIDNIPLHFQSALLSLPYYHFLGLMSISC
jgi:hypothetical protein